MATPYVLARSLKEAHAFAREQLGLRQGHYRVVNSASTVKTVRDVDLHLVPGWEGRYDRFAMKGALRWTRMNVIDVALQQAEEPAAVPDGLDPAGEQLLIPAGASIGDATDFFNDPSTYADDGTDITEEPQAEEPVKPEVKRRRRRCKSCGTLHYKDDDCPADESIPGT